MNISENKALNIGLVVMASGLGKRFGGNKLMEELGEKPLIKWILDSTDTLFDKRIVVTRSDDVKDLCKRLDIDCIVHEFPNRNDTVRLGLSALMEEVDYCFFTPGDQPLISRGTIIELVAQAKKHEDRIIRASYQNVVGTPVGFPKHLFSELLNLPEGKGGNFVAMNNQELVKTVEVCKEYELWDIDTVEDLEKIKHIINTH